LDDSTENNAVIIYNFLNKQWESIDTYGDTNTTFDILDLIVAGKGTNRAVYAINKQGGVHQLDVNKNGQDAIISTLGQTTATAVEVNGVARTRQFTIGSIDRKKWNDFEIHAESGEFPTDFSIAGNTENIDEDNIDLKTLHQLNGGSNLAAEEDVAIRGRIGNKRAYGLDIEITRITGRPKATVASGLNGGAGYNSSDTITSTTLNNHVNNATVTGIVDADVASNAAIAFTKLAPITSQKVIGSIGSGNAEIDIVGTNGLLLDEDDLVTDSNTKGATQQSIKAYIDAEINKTLGFNQTWQVVTRARDNTTSYTNDTGKPIITRLLAIKTNVGAGSNDDISIDIAITPSGGSETYIRLIDSVGDNGYGADIGQIVVPVGASYKFRDNSAVGLSAAVHHELR
jgi:hypothetical protein